MEKPNRFLKPYDSPLIIDTKDFRYVVKKVREFFSGKGFLEVSTQNRLSILAACEDPFNVAEFDYANTKWPLPQTGQMWLEYELLKNKDVNGYYCLTTSYRLEPNPVEGRHDIIFPLFEFEMKGGMEALIELEKGLLEHLGYDLNKVKRDKYEDLAKGYKVEELEHEHEEDMCKDGIQGYFITDFPELTHPFWNMRRAEEGTAKKVDVILGGQETIGSAEREVDKEMMLEKFRNIMDGKYKDKLFELFGEERTMVEMDDYLNFEFFERCGGGIGMTRLIRSMKKEGLIPDNN